MAALERVRKKRIALKTTKKITYLVGVVQVEQFHEVRRKEMNLLRAMNFYGNLK